MVKPNKLCFSTVHTPNVRLHVPPPHSTPLGNYFPGRRAGGSSRDGPSGSANFLLLPVTEIRPSAVAGPQPAVSGCQSTPYVWETPNVIPPWTVNHVSQCV